MLKKILYFLDRYKLFHLRKEGEIFKPGFNVRFNPIYIAFYWRTKQYARVAFVCYSPNKKKKFSWQYSREKISKKPANGFDDF